MRSCLIFDSIRVEREAAAGDLGGDLEGERVVVLDCFAGGERERELEYDRRLLEDLGEGERERDLEREGDADDAEREREDEGDLEEAEEEE